MPPEIGVEAAVGQGQRAQLQLDRLSHGNPHGQRVEQAQPERPIALFVPLVFLLFGRRNLLHRQLGVGRQILQAIVQ